MRSLLLRFGPTRLVLAALVGLLWAFSFGAAREFVWADLRQGMISLRGLSRTIRWLVGAGFILVFAMVVALLFSDLWRAQSPLMAMTRSVPGRGHLVPIALVPVTLFLLSVAWSFILAGALHCHWAIRLVALLFYQATVLPWLYGFFSASSLDGFGSLLTAVGLAITVPVLYIARWRAQPRPILEFLLLSPCVAAAFAVGQLRGVEQLHAFGVPVVLANIELSLISLRLLILPFLLLLGINIASFTWRAGEWTASLAREQLPSWMVGAGLLGLGLWRLTEVGAELLERIQEFGIWTELFQYLGAAFEPLIVVFMGLVFGRVWHGGRAQFGTADLERTVERHAPLVILGASAATFVLHFLTDHVWSVIGAVALVSALVAFHRGRHPLALYLALFASLNVWWEITSPGNLLGAVGWRGDEPADFWWVVFFSGVALFWLVRRTLTPERVLTLSALLLITWLLRQTDFIEDPFSPFFAFAGVAFIAFSVIWDVFTRGSWANETSRALPRVSRIFMYVGYVLLTVTVVNWVLTAHDIGAVQEFTGNVALVGLSRYGRPLLYGLFFLALFLPPTVPALRQEPTPESPLAPAETPSSPAPAIA